MHDDVIPLKGALDVDRRDPKLFGLTIITVPLNLRPDRDWIDCFNSPATWSVSVHKSIVQGDRIIVRANSSRIDDDLKWVFSYIDQANKSYHSLMERKQNEDRRLQELAEKREKERQALTDRLRRL